MYVLDTSTMRAYICTYVTGFAKPRTILQTNIFSKAKKIGIFKLCVKHVIYKNLVKVEAHKRNICLTYAYYVKLCTYVYSNQ